jgi:hypothetical protein
MLGREFLQGVQINSSEEFVSKQSSQILLKKCGSANFNREYTFLSIQVDQSMCLAIMRSVIQLLNILTVAWDKR